MALTNPTRLVNVQRLAHFKAKLDEVYATIAQAAALAAAIGYDADYEFVDLGLPSGTLWAKCNVGATVETGYGNYYKYGKGAEQYNSVQADYTGTETPLDPTKDTATVVMGAPWHMPTKAQLDELVANTTFSWETNFNGSGINGGKYTAANGNYVFFPAAGIWDAGSRYEAGSYGYYWSSSALNSSGAYDIFFSIGSKGVRGENRKYGISVRGVIAGTDVHLINVKAALALKADKSELPTFATPAECRAIVTDYVPTESDD